MAEEDQSLGPQYDSCTAPIDEQMSKPFTHENAGQHGQWSVVTVKWSCVLSLN